MAIQRTLSIIKPDAVAKNVIGEIISRFEKNNLKIIAAKLITLSASDAGGFYAEHKGKPFYDDLIEFNSLTFLFGNNSFTSSYIFSTPGPYIINWQLSSERHLISIFFSCEQ